MAETQEEFVNLIRTVGHQVANLSTTVGAQGVARIIKPFSGESKFFKEWIKEIEKYAVLVRVTDPQIKYVAYQASGGPVSDFLKRYLEANADHSWDQAKAELTARFSDIVDSQHALLLLRNVKQKQNENIQVFAERLLTIGDDAFTGQPQVVADRQLVGFFIDGLMSNSIKLKVMRDDPQTMQHAIAIATTEQNLRKRFDLRTGQNSLNKSDLGENRPQPMEIGHMRGKRRCYNCQKVGHIARDCRAKPKQVNASMTNRDTHNYRQIICYNCHKPGHFARDCRDKRHLNDQTPRM